MRRTDSSTQVLCNQIQSMQSQIQSMQSQIQSMHTQINELFKIINIRTEDIIVREHTLQNDINDIKLFLKTKLGAPDSSKLKDIMKTRLIQERFDYRK